MAIPKSLTDTFYSKANEGLLSSDDTQRLGADEVSRRIRASENEELLSHDSMAGLTLRGDKWARYNDDVRTRAQEGSKKDGGIDILLMHLLDEIQRLNNELETLRRDMAVMEAGFEAEFGEDWHDDMANMYLTDAEKEAFEGLTGDARDEAILQAMKDKMLNADGSIKPGYEGTKIAKYVQMHDREQEVSIRVENVQEAYDSGDPVRIEREFQSIQHEQRFEVANKVAENDQTGTLKNEWVKAVSDDAGLELAVQTDAVDVEVYDDGANAMDLLNSF